jgi:hypothetical protein
MRKLAQTIVKGTVIFASVLTLLLIYYIGVAAITLIVGGTVKIIRIMWSL